MSQHVLVAQQRGRLRVASRLRAQHWQVVRSWFSHVRTSLAASVASFLFSLREVQEHVSAMLSAYETVSKEAGIELPYVR